MNLISFQKQFNNEQDCIDCLAISRWGAIDKAICPHCKSDNTNRFKSGKLYKCYSCNKKFSVKIGTIFEDSKVELLKWFLSIYLFTSLNKGLSSIQLSKYIEVTQKTAWYMLQRIREVVSDSNSKLDGIVEIDEVYIGGKEANRHMQDRIKGKKNKSIILGMVERESKQVKTIKIDNAKTNTIHNQVVSSVEAKSAICTDSYVAYNYLYSQCTHHTINHEKGEYVRYNREVFKIHTNTVEGFWSQLKKGINGIYHWVSKKHIQKYLNEYSFRYNTRKLEDGSRFDKFLCASQGKKLTYINLING